MTETTKCPNCNGTNTIPIKKTLHQITKAFHCNWCGETFKRITGRPPK